jgi:methylmalonyl-CoA/ethylmalonyl-CoA epimerase
VTPRRRSWLSEITQLREVVLDLENASIGQLLIPVENLERAIAFYRDTLGLRFLFSAPPQMSFFQVGSVRLLVGVPQGNQPRQRGSAIYFQVPDIQDVFHTLSGRGVDFGSATPHVVHRTEQTELWLVEFQDPDGNHLVLMSQTPRMN